MCELLIKAIDSSNPDPAIDAGCYKKGDIVVIEDNGHVWGLKEGLPDFVIVKVPETPLASALAYQSMWYFNLGYELQSVDTLLDKSTVRIYSELPGAANEYGLTREKVEIWLTNWGASIISTSTNEVIFDILIGDALQSVGFWGYTPENHNITISELSYDSNTGLHTVLIDYTLSNVSGDSIVAHVLEYNATITSKVNKTITVEFTRADVRTKFITKLKEAVYKVNKRRQYYISSVDVDLVISNGGVITITQTQLLNKLLNKAA